MRLWFLNPLSQIVLGVHLIHYWYSDAGEKNTIDSFLGNLATTLVYFVYARLEETWISAQHDTDALETGWFHKLRLSWDRLMTFLSYFHVILGSTLLIYQFDQFFEMPWEPIALAAISFLIALASFKFSGGPLVLATWITQAGSILILFNHYKNPEFLWLPNEMLTEETVWLLEQLVPLIMLCCSSMMLVSSVTRKRPLFFVSGLGRLILGSLAHFFSCAIGFLHWCGSYLSGLRYPSFSGLLLSFLTSVPFSILETQVKVYLDSWKNS